METKNIQLDMAGRPLPDRTYPAETGSEGYKLWERTLGEWLEYWAETTPDKEYIVYSDRNLRFTWSKFNERVDNLAKGLISSGVKRGSNVGIWATNVPDWLTFLYATAKMPPEQRAFPVPEERSLYRYGEVSRHVQYRRVTVAGSERGRRDAERNEEAGELLRCM